METTITGLFTTAAAAQQAQSALQAAGFGADHTMVINAETHHRHELLGEETSDAVRGSTLGGVVGAVGMAIAAVALALPPVSLLQVPVALAALGGAACGAVAGGLIGFLVGSATGHQMQEEYEYGIERGGVVVAVNTDRVHAAKAHEVLVRSGGHSLSTSVHRKHHEKQQSA